MLPTRHGEFRMIAYESEIDRFRACRARERLGGNSATPVLVRMHSHCLAGNVFGGTLCDCHSILDRSLEMIAHAGSGALSTCTRHRAASMWDDAGRLAFHREIRPSSASDHQHKTQREIGVGAQILSDLNIPLDSAF